MQKSYKQQRAIAVVLIGIGALLLLVLSRGPLSFSAAAPAPSATPALFDGASAMNFAQAQCALGPRPTDTDAGRATGKLISEKLKAFGWTVETQAFQFRGKNIRNLIGKRGQGELVIVGAHYDTRPRADNDPINPNAPIVGGNDGASGAAVLLELARVLPRTLNKEVWLAFFDAEDMGGIDGWPFSVGAEHLASSLTRKPLGVIVLDMIGDRDQQIFYEANSHAPLQQELFKLAEALGYQAHFFPTVKHSITDDHTPFLMRGYPAVDLIDFDYPYWHTLQDTCDKIGPESLERVGRVVQRWLLK